MEQKNRIDFPCWNVESIVWQIRSLLETPHMTAIDLHIHADLESGPTISYTVTRFDALDSKWGKM